MSPARKKKLLLSRETLRSMTRADLERAGGALQYPRTRYTACAQNTCVSCQTVCTSCGDSDCCLSPSWV